MITRLKREILYPRPWALLLPGYAATVAHERDVSVDLASKS
jgi:hypothetical protein